MKNYSYPKEILPHQVNQVRPEFIGFHATNSYVTGNSPSRNTMMSSHVSQHLVTANLDIPYTLSGTEVEYSKYTTSDRIPWDARVVQVIDRYPKGMTAGSLSFNPEKIVVICNDETGEYDCVSVPYHKSFHQYFGYKNDLSDKLDFLPAGSRLGKDTVLGDTPANLGRFYSCTTNLNCMLASADVVAEDSVLISEEAAELLKYRVYEKRSASVGSRKFPLNMNSPDSEEYKAFYEIGEYTDTDGAIIRLRSYVEGLAPAMMSRKAVCTPDHIFDETVYARQGHRGRIVDIRVIGNAESISSLPPKMAAQFEKYRKAYMLFCEELLACERRIFREAAQKFNTERPFFSGRFNQLLVEARAVTDKGLSRTGSDALQAVMNKKPMDEYFIEFTIEYELLPTIGSKSTSINGDKGVTTSIIPRSRMPRDADGNIADMVTGPDSLVARTNYARSYLMQNGAHAREITKRLHQITGLGKDATVEEVEYLDPAKFDEAWDLVVKAHDCVNPLAAKLIDELPRADKTLHLAECLESDFRFIRDVGCSKPAPHAAIDLHNLAPFCFGPVTHQLIEEGVDVVTKESFLIAPLPIMLLDKTAENTLTVGTAALGPFGVPIKSNQSDRYSKPWKDSAPRTLGDTETRAYTAHTKDPEMAVDMMDRATNPDVQLEIARQLVNSETPGGIADIVDRRKFPYGNTRPIGISTNFFSAYGIRLAYVPEDMNDNEPLVRK